MILLYIALTVVSLLSLRPLKKGEIWNKNYISKDTANMIKGICI